MCVLDRPRLKRRAEWSTSAVVIARQALEAELALEYLRKMEAEGLGPDGISFACCISAMEKVGEEV